MMTFDTPAGVPDIPVALTKHTAMLHIASLDHVSKSYGSTRALNEFSCELNEGEVVALLGPNGAGKTTAISVLLGLRKPDSGSAQVFGDPPLSMRARTLIGVTPQETSFPLTLTVTEVLEFVAVHYPTTVPIDAILKRFELEQVARKQTGGLSGGLRRRLGVALAFVGKPRLMFLDEPTTGLDVESRLAVWDAIRENTKLGTTVLLTTHNLEEAEALATRVLVMNAGQLIANDTVAAIKSKVGLKRVALTSDTPIAVASVVPTEIRNNRYTYVISDVDSFVADLVKAGTVFRDLEVVPMTLEEAFLKLVQRPVS